MKLWQRIVAFITVMLAAVALVVWLVILPTISDIKKISNDVYLEVVDLEKKWERGQRLRETVLNFEKIQSERGKLAQAFIIKGQELTFITSLEGLAAERSLVQNIQPQFNQPISRAGFEEIPLTITLQGEFHSLLQYLQDLEQLSYYVTITALNLNAGAPNARQAASNITATLVGRVYRLSAQTQ